jgi:hypothetical protein
MVPVRSLSHGFAARCPAVASGESLSGFHAAWGLCHLPVPDESSGRSWASWRALRGRRALGGRFSDDCTPDASSEEMADGDPQMAECLGRSTLCGDPATMAGAAVARYDALSSGCGRANEEALKSRRQIS